MIGLGPNSTFSEQLTRHLVRPKEDPKQHHDVQWHEFSQNAQQERTDRWQFLRLNRVSIWRTKKINSGDFLAFISMIIISIISIRAEHQNTKTPNHLITLHTSPNPHRQRSNKPKWSLPRTPSCSSPWPVSSALQLLCLLRREVTPMATVGQVSLLMMESHTDKP